MGQSSRHLLCQIRIFGGIQISILLARVCKLLARDAPPLSLPDLLTTFFSHYATFDWKNEIAFDPFFHRTRLQYTRTAREPLSILGYFPPTLNTSHAASLPSVRTISEEFKRVNELLSSPEACWSSFFSSRTLLAEQPIVQSGALEFLSAYKSYVRLDVQFWGLSATKGAQYVGWLESRCVILLVDIGRRIPGIHSHIWPARFVSVAEENVGDVVQRLPGPLSYWT